MRTKRLLTTALLELIQERRWEKINVQDLLDRTGVSRSTFYAHYENKLDVLTSGIPTVADSLVVDPAGTIDLEPLIRHVDEMAPVFAPLLSQPVLGEIVLRFHRELVEVITPLVETPLAADFIAGGLLAAIRAHVSQPTRRHPDEVVAELAILVEAALG
ncbi:MAG: TetR/AcrR family transcriptional regulator [Acidimicrobiales bacterium]